MQSNLATKFLPIVSDEKKIEVSLTDNQAIIKLSTWTEDLGWCCQKTLALDAEMLDDLHRVIASARYKMNSRKNETLQEEKMANVLSFPKFS
jgi:predicted DCC family thiol-disulfide oxidoreductase YuxK